MAKTTAVIRISVPEGAETPIILIRDALERYCGNTYPIWVGPRDDGPLPHNTDYAIVLEEEEI